MSGKREVAVPAPARLGTAPDRFLTPDGVRLRCREIGLGEPVVLLHGYTARLEFMGELADVVALLDELHIFRSAQGDAQGRGQTTPWFRAVTRRTPLYTNFWTRFPS